jgi:hypothetical protein
MLVATALNYVRVQAEAAVRPDSTEAQRAFGAGEVVRCLPAVPDPVVLARLVKECESVGP